MRLGFLLLLRHWRALRFLQPSPAMHEPVEPFHLQLPPLRLLALAGEGFVGVVVVPLKVAIVLVFMLLLMMIVLVM